MSAERLEQIRFESQEHPEKYGYVFVRDSWSSDSGFYRDPARYINRNVFMFETYGDGMTQHSNLYLVPATGMKDFVISLAFYLESLKGEERDLAVELVRVSWPESYRGPETKESVIFLREMRKKGEKRTWYNYAERKIGTKESLQYDKRWEEIPGEWKGSLPEIFYYLQKDFHGALERAILWEAIRDHLNWPWVDEEDETKALHFSRRDTCTRQALNYLERVVESARLLDHARGEFSCLKSNYEQERKTDLPQEVKDKAA